MFTQEKTLKILNCSKMTLARYVKKGKLTRVRKGKRSFYDEREVALLAKEIDDNKKKAGIKTETVKKVELPPEVNKEIENLSADTCLNKVGMQYLQEATKSLIEMGIYEECDKHILLAYALSAQAYNHYFVKAMEIDGVSNSIDTGRATIHPYHKIMMEHQKAMMNYSNMLGLNPSARAKLNIEKKQEPSSILEVLNED